MNNKTFTIGIDVDDVLAALLNEWLRRYNFDFSDNLQSEDIKQWDLVPYVKEECGKRIYEYIEDPTIYDNIEPIENAWWGVNCLRQFGHRVIFITSSTQGHAGRKYRWLQEHNFLPNRKDYIEAEDKSLICINYLVDDRPLNVEKSKGVGVLFSKPHNLYFDWNLRMNNWEEVAKYFMNETNRALIYG